MTHAAFFHSESGNQLYNDNVYFSTSGGHRIRWRHRSALRFTPDDRGIGARGTAFVEYGERELIRDREEMVSPLSCGDRYQRTCGSERIDAPLFSYEIVRSKADRKSREKSIYQSSRRPQTIEGL